MKAGPAIARMALVCMGVLGLGACAAPQPGPASPCDPSLATRCLTSYDDWGWAGGIARAGQF